MELRKGVRVMTPRGVGTVVYVRMAPPDYAQVEAASVYLDCEIRHGYSGTIFPVDALASSGVSE